MLLVEVYLSWINSVGIREQEWSRQEIVLVPLWQCRGGCARVLENNRAGMKALLSLCFLSDAEKHRGARRCGHLCSS